MAISEELNILGMTPCRTSGFVCFGTGSCSSVVLQRYLEVDSINLIQAMLVQLNKLLPLIRDDSSTGCTEAAEHAGASCGMPVAISLQL